MIKGIDPLSETHRDTKKMLFSLGEILTKNNPDYMKSRITYQEFLNDPSFKKKPELETEDNTVKKTFSDNIRFIENHTTSG